MTDTKQMPSTEFRISFGRLEEPVDVTVLGRVIGHWYPAGVATTPAYEPGSYLPLARDEDSIATRIDSVIPFDVAPGKVTVHDNVLAPTSRPGPDDPPRRTQAGVPEPSQAAAPPAHEPGDVQHSAPLGSSPLSIIPPKPADYVHDPAFGKSRPAPKTKGGTR